MKKVISLLLSIFLLTGCNITYELEMDKNGGIIDKLTIIEKYDNYNNNLNNLRIYYIHFLCVIYNKLFINIFIFINSFINIKPINIC